MAKDPLLPPHTVEHTLCDLVTLFGGEVVVVGDNQLNETPEDDWVREADDFSHTWN